VDRRAESLCFYAGAIDEADASVASGFRGKTASAVHNDLVSTLDKPCEIGFVLRYKLHSCKPDGVLLDIRNVINLHGSSPIPHLAGLGD